MILSKLRERGGWFRAISAVSGAWATIADVILASLFINILALSLPIVLMQVYDRIIRNDSRETLTWLVVGCSIAIVLEASLRFVRALSSSWLAARFEHLASCDMIESLLKMKPEDFRKQEAGFYLDRLNAVSSLKSIYAGGAFQVLMDLPFAMLFFAGIWYLGERLVLIPVGATVVFFVVSVVVKFAFRKARNGQIEADDRRFSFLIEVLSGIYTVKALALEEQMMRRYEFLHEKTSNAQLRVGKLTLLPVALGAFFTQLAMFGVIIFGAKYVIVGAMTFGSLAACTMLVGRGMQPILQLAGFMVRFSDAEVAVAKIREVAEMVPEGKEASFVLPMELRGAVELQNVSFRYAPELPLVLDNIDFSLTPGQFCCVRGGNGSGGTTLLRLVYGALTPASGRVLIDGFNIVDCDRGELRGRVELLAADAVLFQGTILDNITLFNSANSSAAFDVAAMTGLNDLVANLPKGYETVVSSKSNSFLPRGLVQRICIARALVKRPRVLLLDETYAAMDAETLDMFSWLLDHLRGKCTIILVGNATRFMDLSDTVYRLEQGRLVLEHAGRSKRGVLE